MASLLPADSRPGRPPLDPNLNDVAKRVHEEFDEHLDPSDVDECLDQIAAQFEAATIRSFIPCSCGATSARSYRRALAKPD